MPKIHPTKEERKARAERRAARRKKGGVYKPPGPLPLTRYLKRRILDRLGKLVRGGQAAKHSTKFTKKNKSTTRLARKARNKDAKKQRHRQQSR